MPRTSTLNIDGKYYEVKYSASTDDITFNGYKGTVYQPLPGTEAAKTKITLTVTDKSNAEVTASKTLDFAIARPWLRRPAACGGKGEGRLC